MKISHRLLALSGFSAAGLVCVPASATSPSPSIQTDLRGLTSQAAPLQSKTYELQERTERAMGRLLKLSLARNTAEASQASQAAESDLKAIEQLRRELVALDPKAGGEAVDFRASQAEIGKAVAQRPGRHRCLQQETEAAAWPWARPRRRSAPPAPRSSRSAWRPARPPMRRRTPAAGCPTR